MAFLYFFNDLNSELGFISANDSALDLNAHTISADSVDIPEAGIHITGDDNLVRGGIVEGFGLTADGANILVENGNHNMVISMISQHANRGGIHVIAREGFRATHNHIKQNLVDTTNNFSAGVGMYSVGGRVDFNEVRDNKVQNTASHGIHVRSEAGEIFAGTASNNYVARNVINNTEAAGLAVFAATGATLDNRIMHNRIKDTGEEGIIMQAVEPAEGFESFIAGNAVTYNFISNTTQSGVFLNAEFNASVNTTQIMFNDIADTALHAIHLTDANGGEVKENGIDRNIVAHNEQVTSAFSDCTFPDNFWVQNRINGTNVFGEPPCVTL